MKVLNPEIRIDPEVSIPVFSLKWVKVASENIDNAD